jgi:hypothetical protein
MAPVACADQTDPQPVSIPFSLSSQNNIVVSATLNDQDSLRLMLHTAASDVMLTEDAIREAKSFNSVETAKLNSWGGEGSSRMSIGNTLQIGELLGSNMNVFEDKNSGKDTDGKFGLDFFRNKIVEIDFDELKIVLHAALPRKAESFERLKIENQNGLLFVHGTCLIENQSYDNQFLLHSGYSGGILLDDSFAERSGVDGKIEITDESTLTDSFGHIIHVKKGIVPKFTLGSSSIPNAPVGFFAGKIGAQKMSVIGCEILTRFNIIFDTANDDLYMALR